jgi:hypothetical protein
VQPSDDELLDEDVALDDEPEELDTADDDDDDDEDDDELLEDGRLLLELGEAGALEELEELGVGAIPEELLPQLVAGIASPVPASPAMMMPVAASTGPM